MKELSFSKETEPQIIHLQKKGKKKKMQTHEIIQGKKSTISKLANYIFTKVNKMVMTKTLVSYPPLNQLEHAVTMIILIHAPLTKRVYLIQLWTTKFLGSKQSQTSKIVSQIRIYIDDCVVQFSVIRKELSSDSISLKGLLIGFVVM